MSDLDSALDWIVDPLMKSMDFECTSRQIKLMNEIRKNYQSAINDKSQLYIEAIESIPVPLFMKDSQLNVVFSNRAFDRIYNSYLKQDLDIFSGIVEQEKTLLMEPAGQILKIMQLANLGISYWGSHVKYTDYSGVVQNYIAGTLRVFSSEEELKLNIAYLQEQLARFSLSDEITGIGNRNFAISNLESFINNHLRYEENFSIVLIKVDNLGEISRKFGNTEGNYTLLAIAQKLRSNLRSGDVATRYTDDQFLVLVKDRRPSNVGYVADRLRKELHKISFDTPHPLKVSIGVACHNVGETKDELLNKALDDMRPVD
ncbi:MAG: GGDEF domain-containing protein [Succinivibrionaceae bacterium]|nr:GGDEF domain-containing protein [Succinivibrionaceae bacterium]